jgi:hypothetical protein
MPDSEDVDSLPSAVYFVDDPIGSQDDLSYGLLGLLRDGSVRERQFGCALDAVEDAIGEVGRGGGIVVGDELNDLPEIVGCGSGLDYSASHLSRLSLTSS